MVVLTTVLTALEDDGAALDEVDLLVLRGFGGLLEMVAMLLVKCGPLLLEDVPPPPPPSPPFFPYQHTFLPH